jgi:hypothetical protein
MTLSTEVQARYPSQLLVNITNPMETTATTVNTTTLNAAATDVEADFEIVAGVEYDGTDARHVAVAVEGVIAKLLRRTGTSQYEEREKDYNFRLRDLAKVTGRDRITPESDSEVSPAVDSPSGVEVKPAFDNEIFDQIIPGAP